MYDYEKIKNNLTTKYIGQTFVQFEDLISVHLKAKNISENCPAGMLVLTEKQEDVKLKNSRTWYSNCGDGLFLSIILNNNNKKDYTSQIVQIANAAVCETILQLDDKISCYIKWPNDIYINDKKVGSVFAEKIDKKDNDSLIISIYLNITDVKENQIEEIEEIKDRKISLSDICGEDIDREKIISNILNKIEIYYDELIERKTIKSSLTVFKNHNFVLGKTIGVKKINKKTVKKVEAIDINNHGEIEIKDNNGAKDYLKYGQDTIEWWEDRRSDIIGVCTNR